MLMFIPNSLYAGLAHPIQVWRAILKKYCTGALTPVVPDPMTERHAKPFFLAVHNVMGQILARRQFVRNFALP